MRSEDELKAKLNELLLKKDDVDKKSKKLPIHGERKRILEREIIIIDAEIECFNWMLQDFYQVKIVSQKMEEQRDKMFGS